jgi:LmbE family N-acetylglucosaminyl deacetylase
MKTYRDYVTALDHARRQARYIAEANQPPCQRKAPAKDAPVTLIFAPHPDDEVIIGALPLRLLKESGYRVINIPVTLGSRLDRREERATELANACRYIGYELESTGPCGLERVNLKTRREDPAHWNQSVQIIAKLLRKHQPRVIFAPHSNDWNSTHIGTHHQVVDALGQLDGFSCFLVETEFWHPMTHPNVMIETSPEDTAELVTAISFHTREVQRNPYHLLLPPWMQDNVRRGSEHLAGQGSDAPDFGFATLYRVNRWAGRQAVAAPPDKPFWACSDNPCELFQAD